jgi:hypothetical protein
VFSDLFCDPEDLLHCFRHLRFRKHDLAVFHLLDPAELNFVFDRPIRFADLESTESLVAEPGAIRARYLAELERYLARLRSGCLEFRVDYRLVRTDQDYEGVLADFLLARMRA